jgi:hypothetical protein
MIIASEFGVKCGAVRLQPVFVESIWSRDPANRYPADLSEVKE